MPPQTCTLPTAEQPLRVAELDGLLREQLAQVQRVATDDVLAALAQAARPARRPGTRLSLLPRRTVLPDPQASVPGASHE